MAVDEVSEDVVAEVQEEQVIEEPLAAKIISPDTNTSDAIASAINNASEGDTIDLGVFESYVIEGVSLKVTTPGITIKGNGNTVINGFGYGKGIFHVTANGVTIQGIKFIDTDPYSVLTYYDDDRINANHVRAEGVTFLGASNGVVDNCTFINFEYGVKISEQSNDVKVKNCYFTGVTNYLRNDPQVNVEKGTKAIGVMESQRTQIINNLFNGSMLNAIYFSSGCGDFLVLQNVFIGNCYAIYFGGAPKSNITIIIKQNNFINIGHYEGVDAKTENPVVWDKLPVISIQKSADGIIIAENKFSAIDNNVLVAVEARNTTDGGLSELGNIKVLNNIVSKYTPDVASQSVVLLHILTRVGELNPVGDIVVENNTFDGKMKSVEYWDTNWVSNSAAWYIKDGNVVIPKGKPTLIATELTVSAPSSIYAGDSGTLKVTLKAGGVVLANQTVTVSINGANKVLTTNENGVATTTLKYSSADTKYVYVTYIDSTGKYLSAQKNTKVVINKKATTITAPAKTFKVKATKKVAITLKSGGKAVTGKKVTINVGGKNFNAKTNSKGVATITVKLTKAGTFKYTAKFAGDGAYKAISKTGKIVVKK